MISINSAPITPDEETTSPAISCAACGRLKIKVSRGKRRALTARTAYRHGHGVTTGGDLRDRCSRCSEFVSGGDSPHRTSHRSFFTPVRGQRPDRPWRNSVTGSRSMSRRAERITCKPEGFRLPRPFACLLSSPGALSLPMLPETVSRKSEGRRSTNSAPYPWLDLDSSCRRHLHASGP